MLNKNPLNYPRKIFYDSTYTLCYHRIFLKRNKSCELGGKKRGGGKMMFFREYSHWE